MATYFDFSKIEDDFTEEKGTAYRLKITTPDGSVFDLSVSHDGGLYVSAINGLGHTLSIKPQAANSIIVKSVKD